jgi:hypothetical protein
MYLFIKRVCNIPMKCVFANVLCTIVRTRSSIRVLSSFFLRPVCMCISSQSHSLVSSCTILPCTVLTIRIIFCAWYSGQFMAIVCAIPDFLESRTTVLPNLIVPPPRATTGRYVTIVYSNSPCARGAHLQKL